MQITQAPPLPAGPTAVTQPQALATTLPHVLTQAVAPISQNAITPTTKGERGERSRRREEKDREGAPKKGEESRGGHVNISV